MCSQVRGLFCHGLNLDFKWSVKKVSLFSACNVFTFTPSIQEFVKGCGSVTKRWVDGLLDKMTAGDHIKAVSQIRQVSDLYLIYSNIQYYTLYIHHPLTLQGHLEQFFFCAYFTFQKRNIMLKPDETKSSLCDLQVCCSLLKVMAHLNSCWTVWLKLCIFVQMADGTGLGESGSVLDFMSMKNYPDMSLDISMLNSLGDYPLNILTSCIYMYTNNPFTT